MVTTNNNTIKITTVKNGHFEKFVTVFTGFHSKIFPFAKRHKQQCMHVIATKKDDKI